MLRYASIWLLLLLITLGWSCKDAYVSPYKTPATGYLVVEGYISGNTITTFNLSRTISLPGDSTLPTEGNASVEIQGNDNTTYPLANQGNGTYSSSSILALNTQHQYRLHIRTGSGEYYSDYVPYKPTPAIDSVNFIQNGDNSIVIYANTHDPAGNTRYYQWNYDQTYEYHSAEDTYVYYNKDSTPPIVIRPVNDNVFRCWQSSGSTTIIVGSSSKLASDVIYEQPIKKIPADDIQTSVLYSILVRQYSLTDSAYTFLTLMQKNTESLGSIFDAQPSQLSGNIHSTTNPSEPVIGYVCAGTVTQQRLWISKSQIRSSYTYACEGPDTTFNPHDSAGYSAIYAGPTWTPMYNKEGPGGGGWVSNYTVCLVCTARGGVNVPPPFWPN